MEIRIIINNCGECPNYKFYKKCKVLNIKVNKKYINEKCPYQKTFNDTKDIKLKYTKDIKLKYTKDKRLKNKYEDRIKEILKSKNMTITELAKIFNISKVAMFILITTVTKKHSKQRQRIADFLNVPYDSIFEAKKNDLKK